MRQVGFTIGTAFRSEKTKTAKKLNQCASFKILAIAVEGLETPRLDEGRNIVSFKCDKFVVVGEHSSKEWEKLFSIEKDGEFVIIVVPQNYILGPIIFGFR